ncbi:MAG TPA: SulP family inorganic anion transporter [Kiritimatiellia bacterium]|nr:SulP family inorganic anion transporter [Kiritimatiellia bacterium]
MSPFPFTADIQRYNGSALRGDLQAGVTVAVFAIPQVMAYALLAGVPVAYGFYAAVIMSITAALWGSSPFVNTGPTNTAALLTAAALAPLLPTGNLVEIVCTLALMVGVIRLLMGLMKMGRLMAFVPESAMLGFTAGVGVLIALSQLHFILGVDAPLETWFPARLAATLSCIEDIDLITAGIGFGVLVIMTLLDKKARKVPIAMITMVATGILAWWMRESHPLPMIRTISETSFGWPNLVVPSHDVELWRNLAPSALAIAMIGLMEAVSIGQTLALKRRQELDVNQEFTGQGIAQIVTAFFQGFPGSGSFSRSLLIELSGGQTRFSNVIFGIATAGILLIGASFLGWIPVSALSGLLLFIGIRLIDPARLKQVFQTSASEGAILALTFIITVFVRIEYGIFSGIIAAALLHMHRTRSLHLVEFVPDAEGRLHEIPYQAGASHTSSAVVVTGLSGDLYYGASTNLRGQLEAIIRDQQPKHLVVRLRRANSIDYSCWHALLHVAETLHQTGGAMYLCGIRPDYQRIIAQSGMNTFLPPERLFAATAAPFEAFEYCLRTIMPQLSGEHPAKQAWERYLRR